MDKLRKFRVYILAAALILVWVLVALLSRCGRAEAVTDGRDGVVVCDTMPRLCPADTSWTTVPSLKPSTESTYLRDFNENK